MGRIGASLEGAELRLLNQLARAEAQPTLDTLHHLAAEKVHLASDHLIDSINKLTDVGQQFISEKNQALASNALASINLLHQQRSQIADIINKLTGP